MSNFSMSRSAVRAGAVCVLVLAAAVPPAQRATGAPGAATICDWHDSGTVEPAITMSPASSEYSTHGETGTITCDGKIDGAMPSGPGTIGFEARMGPAKPVTCTSGGDGDYTGFYTFPTAGGGHIHGVEYGQFTFGIKNGKFGGTYRGSTFSGTFDAAIVKGDCTKGVTEVSFHTKDALVSPHSRKVVIPAGD